MHSRWQRREGRVISGLGQQHKMDTLETHLLPFGWNSPCVLTSPASNIQYVTFLGKKLSSALGFRGTRVEAQKHLRSETLRNIPWNSLVT